MGVAQATDGNFAPAGASDHGALAGLADDDHLQYALLAGRALGQTLIGGTLATENLDLQANVPNNGAGRVRSLTGFEVVDALANGAAASQIFRDTTSVGAFVGGGIQSLGTITYTASTFIWALLQESKGYIANVGPGFAAFTLFNAIPFIRNGTNNALVQALVLNVGISHQATGVNSVTTVGTTGVSFSPNTRALSNGSTMTKTSGDTALRVSPTWGTVPGSTINFGTIRGVHFFQPAQALFQGSGGVENMTAYLGIDFPNFTFGGASATVEVIRSALNSGTNKRFINHTGTALSDFGGSIRFLFDLAGITYGSGQDFFTSWGAAAEHFWQWNSSGDQLRWSNELSQRYVLQTENGNNDGEFNLGFSRFSFGQTGSVGNQVGVFVANARTVPVAGGWADFLLTQAGNLDILALNMSDVSAWVINAISLASASGNIGDLDTLVVGGMTTSNPGITVSRRSALRVTGRHRQRGTVSYTPIVPAALAAGDNNDWQGLNTLSPSNNGRYWARITGNAAGSAITGIESSAAEDGDTYELTNIGADTITLNHEDAASVAANRIITPDGANFVLSENESVKIRWDDTSSRYRIITPPRTAAFALTGEWQFDNTTTMADPGNGNFRNNNGTLGSVTAIAIADETKPGVDASTILSALSNGDRVYIQNKEDSSQFLVFDITSTTDNTTWWQLNGTVAQSGNAFTDGKEFIVSIIFA